MNKENPITHNKEIGHIHSIQSLGTVDGPGVRCVVFLQGCPLRCKCCHNPDTWETGTGKQMTPTEICEKVKSFRSYFGQRGGVTLSGGEPLLQAQFCRSVFELCHEVGINTCLDTSGIMLSDEVKELLSVTDRVLLDVKYTNEEDYRENTRASLFSVLEFLDYLDECGIPTTLRQVIIPDKNDTEENILRLAEIACTHKCVDGVELLPFKKMCEMKYEALGIEFPLSDTREPTGQEMEKLESCLENALKSNAKEVD